MRHAVELCLDRGVDLRMRVAVDVRPDGGVAIEIPVPVLIQEPAAIARDKHQRLMIRHTPVAHGRERVPEVGFVEVGKVQGIRDKG